VGESTVLKIMPTPAEKDGLEKRESSMITCRYKIVRCPIRRSYIGRFVCDHVFVMINTAVVDEFLFWR
jgi:hypothetical protein